MRIDKKNNNQERQILIGMIVDKIVLSRIISKYQPQMFKSKWANIIAKWCLQYYQKYKKAPLKHIESLFETWSVQTKDKNTVDLVGKFLETLSEEYEELKSESNSSYIIDIAGHYFNQVKIERLMESVESDITEGQPEKAHSRLIGYNKIEMGVGAGINVLQDKEAMQRAFNDDKKEILIKFPGALGKFFGNALERESFIAFLGRKGIGKSFWLQTMAWEGVLQRRRVAFFEAGDNGENQVMRRLMIRAAKHPRFSGDVYYPTRIWRDKNKKRIRRDFEIKEFEKKLSWQKANKACRKIMRKKIKSKDSYFRLSCHFNTTIDVDGIDSILNDWERESGWIPDIVCIAEGSLVLTNKGLVPIEKVTKQHKLWDGLNWITHNGTIYKGEREVIEYAGITATPEHEIWTEKGWRTIESCKQLGLRIAQTGIGRQEIRIGQNYITDSQDKNLQSTEQKIQWIRNCNPQICTNTMHTMLFKEMDISHKSETRNCQRMSSLFATEEISNMVISKNEFKKTNMPKSKKCGMETLWQQRNKVFIPFCYASMFMDCNKFGNSYQQEFANRPNRQQWPLRTGKSQVVNKSSKLFAYKKTSNCSYDSQIQDALSKSKIWRRGFGEVITQGNETRKNCSTVEYISKPLRRKKAKVWDILNAGPFHRFTVQGVLAHNCIDYADILKMVYHGKEGRDCINETWKLLRGLSQKRHCLLITATQSDADSYERGTLTMKNFSDDRRKIDSVTGMIGLNQAELEKKRGIMRLNWISLRDGEFQVSQCCHVAGCLALANPAIKSCF